MRCIFCKTDSSASTSREHIIPESLWNTKQILPRGVVCDGCNNYFARKVEKPFLDSPEMTHLRFHQAVPNKRGRIPPIDATIFPGHAVKVFRHAEGRVAATLAVPPEAFEKVLRGEADKVIFPLSGNAPNDTVTSRFLAKVAIEGLAQRFIDVPGGLDYLIDDAQFDPIRRFARLGVPSNWSHYSRRIYDSNHRWLDAGGETFQVVHEYDLLFTDLGEVYLVLALFGLELTINVGGPDVDGYIAWLADNGGASPLHIGKNAPWNGASVLSRDTN